MHGSDTLCLHVSCIYHFTGYPDTNEALHVLGKDEPSCLQQSIVVCDSHFVRRPKPNTLVYKPAAPGDPNLREISRYMSVTTLKGADLPRIVSQLPMEIDKSGHDRSVRPSRPSGMRTSYMGRESGVRKVSSHVSVAALTHKPSHRTIDRENSNMLLSTRGSEDVVGAYYRPPTSNGTATGGPVAWHQNALALAGQNGAPKKGRRQSVHLTFDHGAPAMEDVSQFGSPFEAFFGAESPASALDGSPMQTTDVTLVSAGWSNSVKPPVSIAVKRSTTVSDLSHAVQRSIGKRGSEVFTPKSQSGKLKSGFAPGKSGSTGESATVGRPSSQQG